ncbi:MAG: hypothetical protein MHM6MM_004485 [Cercozoa sp. M6MM]
MCLLPAGPESLLEATDQSKKYAKYLKIALCAHVVVVILNFVTLDIFSAMFDLVLLMIGFMSLRDLPRYINMQQIMCLTLFSCFRFIMNGISFIMFLVRNRQIGNDPDNETPSWVADVFMVAAIVAIVVYAAEFVIGRAIYNDLRWNAPPIDMAAFGAQGGGGGAFSGFGGFNAGGGGPPGPSGGGDQGGPRGGRADPNRPPANFQAFTGQGHSLK